MGEVHLGVDMIRYNEALDKNESGLNDSREQSLLKKFPPSERLFLDSPAVIIDAGGRIIVWYLPGAITDFIEVHWSMLASDIQILLIIVALQKDMRKATNDMCDLLKKSVTSRKTNHWRTHVSNFHPCVDDTVTAGCINISPCWFQQGREVSLVYTFAHVLIPTIGYRSSTPGSRRWVLSRALGDIER